LRELSRHPSGIGLEDFARQLKQPKSSTHRALSTLRRTGFVAQDENRRYRLSLEFVRLAFAYYEALDQQALVQPALQALADHFGETAHYAVLDGADVIYVARVAPPHATFKMAATVGGRQPAHSTALGKVLLAFTFTNAAEVEEYIAAHGPLAAKTAQTLTTTAALAHELALTRERGYALDDHENEPGVNCIAFPVFLGPTLQPTGAISVSAVAQRIPLVELAAESEHIRAIVEERLGPVTRSQAASPSAVASPLVVSEPAASSSVAGSPLPDQASETATTAPHGP
jgi:DNA-binding IclR family transcriptional regulator